MAPAAALCREPKGRSFNSPGWYGFLVAYVGLHVSYFRKSGKKIAMCESDGNARGHRYGLWPKRTYKSAGRRGARNRPTSRDERLEKYTLAHRDLFATFAEGAHARPACESNAPLALT